MGLLWDTYESSMDLLWITTTSDTPDNASFVELLGVLLVEF
jgi:hypothetical protein